MTVRPTTSYVPVVAGLFAAAAIAWLVVVVQTGGMESAPGTMGLGAASFLGLWTVMMAAMMLPALAPLGILYAGEGRGRTARTCGLAAGYLVAWAVFGGLALAVGIAARDLADRNDSAATWVGAALLVAAGAYQLSPLKNRCLGVCRSPLHALMRTGAYRGPLRHVRAGIYHGAYCIGCCWSLMVERVWRHGKHVAIAAGIGLIALGLLAPSHPGIVPGLHRSPMSMESM